MVGVGCVTERQRMLSGTHTTGRLRERRLIVWLDAETRWSARRLMQAVSEHVRIQTSRPIYLCPPRTHLLAWPLGFGLS